MATDYQRLIHELADLKRRVSDTVRVGTVHEIGQKGDMIRVNFGKGSDGKEQLSQWIPHCGAFNGQTRSRTPLSDKKGQQGGGAGGAGGAGGGGGGSGGGAGGAGGGGGGEQGGGQTITMICPNGDMSQAFTIPGAPNKNHAPPDHANETGKDEETWQHEDNRSSKGKDGADYWLEEPENKEWKDPREDSGGGGGGAGGAGGSGGGAGGAGGQQGQQGQQDGKRKVGGDKAKMKYRMNEKGGFTWRMKTDTRVACHEKGSKLKTKKGFIVAGKDGENILQCEKNLYCDGKQQNYVSKPWQIKQSPKDPVPDDDE